MIHKYIPGVLAARLKAYVYLERLMFRLPKVLLPAVAHKHARCCLDAD